MNYAIQPRKDQAPVLIQGSGYLVNEPKRVATAYVLLLFLGLVGGHRFYIRSTGMGVLYLLTAGLLGIGVLVDVFGLATKVDQLNRRIHSGQGHA